MIRVRVAEMTGSLGFVEASFPQSKCEFKASRLQRAVLCDLSH